jgi:hypothetical protein
MASIECRITVAMSFIPDVMIRLIGAPPGVAMELLLQIALAAMAGWSLLMRSSSRVDALRALKARLYNDNVTASLNKRVRMEPL